MRKLVLMVAVFAAALTLFADEEQSYGDLEGLTEVRFVLSPVEGSRIRVLAYLPEKDKWNGRLVMRGSGGGAGFIDFGCKADARAGAVGCYCDLGTGRPWITEPRCVITDFGHRSTHVAVEAVKRLVVRHFGEGPKWSYFIGESTGGCQGFAEFERYPDDFDGIIAGVPAANRFPLHYYFAYLCKQWLRADGSMRFPYDYFVWMKDAALAEAAATDLPRARGRFLTDSRYDEKRYEAVFARACAAHPEMKDEAAALKAIYSGAVLSGKRIHSGLPLGTLPPDAASLVYFQFFHQWKFGKGKMPHELSDADFEALWADYGPDVDQMSVDLDGFLARGGKAIVFGGLADPIVPPFSICTWYDGLIGRYGLDKTRSFVRFYLLPGRGHGVHGFGEKSCGVEYIDRRDEILFDWVEKGIEPPLVLDGVIPGEANWPLKPYPDNFTAE